MGWWVVTLERTPRISGSKVLLPLGFKHFPGRWEDIMEYECKGEAQIKNKHICLLCLLLVIALKLERTLYLSRVLGYFLGVGCNTSHLLPILENVLEKKK